jgi:hypothetical protein
MSIEVSVNEDAPILTYEEIDSQADSMMLSGIGYAIARAGKPRVRDLCELLGVEEDPANILVSVQRVLSTFGEMEVNLGLNHPEDGGKFTAEIVLLPHRRGTLQ